ncbi:M-phase inducer phosphatase 1-B-like [Anguilla anguilla]|uniref:M-phase inducer phosphatase 1-B-like n=1 Tax=Anguilla anguilla TaxID=7936 RepID=UPI0015A967DC|nr:M-phase inducer phosphatase 1-B-like [Anguilla anguilla]XP_035264209.1 M-phase inducer phosphatase 1-B-like [Anguilla anguilla]
MADALAAGSGAFPRGPHSPDPLLSPMSKLAHCFTGLGATQTGDTPRRCLDLSNISTGSADVAVGPESPCSAPLSDHAQSPQQDSPVPRNSRMKRLKSFLPRLLCSSPKPNSDSHRQGGPHDTNKENVATWSERQTQVQCLLQAPDPQTEGSGELSALGSPISAMPLSPAADFRGADDSDGFMEVLEEQEVESSTAVHMSSSMAQLLSDPLMNQEVDFSSVALFQREGRRLFRSPSMPERLDRPRLKRAPPPPTADPPIKRHRTFPAITEEEGTQDGGENGGTEGRKRRYLLKKTHSLCEVTQHMGGDGVNAELIGDFSKVYALPTVMGRHEDLKYITADTMCALLSGEFSSLIESFVVVDCRYPYEFEGGHIKGALNLPNTDEAVAHLLRQRLQARCPEKRLILVLHCEFSSERAPRTCRLLRRQDRSLNEYPALIYPEVYVLKGGYRDFYHLYRHLCEPQSYCPMHHEDHRDELLRFRTNSRASAEERRRREHITRLIKL